MRYLAKDVRWVVNKYECDKGMRQLVTLKIDGTSMVMEWHEAEMMANELIDAVERGRFDVQAAKREKAERIARERAEQAELAAQAESLEANA